MSKAVLISIKPEWCELIASGKKTIEVRKTKPKLETPFKCYIYCTTTGDLCYKSNNDGKIRITKNTLSRAKALSITHQTFLNGRVIGEFVCDGIISHCEMGNADIAEQQGRIDRELLYLYSNGKELFGWHISDLVIYDKPRELKEFYRECDGIDNVGLCYECDKAVGEECDCALHYELHLTRPPQSWCYVEEV